MNTSKQSFSVLETLPPSLEFVMISIKCPSFLVVNHKGQNNLVITYSLSTVSWLWRDIKFQLTYNTKSFLDLSLKLLDCPVSWKVIFILDFFYGFYCQLVGARFLLGLICRTDVTNLAWMECSYTTNAIPLYLYHYFLSTSYCYASILSNKHFLCQTNCCYWL